MTSMIIQLVSSCCCLLFCLGFWGAIGYAIYVFVIKSDDAE